MALTDTASHPPPTTGTYAYNNPNCWGPDTAGFIAAGATYVDPVFGETVLRVADKYPNSSNSDIYAKNGWFNADSTKFLHRSAVDEWQVINLPACTVARTVVLPGSLQANASFDPQDPDVLYYYSGASIRKILVSTGADSLVKTFAATLQNLGGSVDWISDDGAYWIVRYSDTVRVWHKPTDTLLTGTITAYVTAGWIGISPDGNYVVQNNSATPFATSYAVNKAGASVDTTGVQFWTIGNDHADLISASDGKTYLVTSDINDTPEIRARDVTIAAGTTAEQQTNSILLSPYDWTWSQHYSAPSRGAMQDWAFIEQQGADGYDASVAGWSAYKSELYAVNVLNPAERKRYVHHRSRGAAYEQQPRICVAWDGAWMAWASDFNSNNLQYGDIYAIRTIAEEAGASETVRHTVRMSWPRQHETSGGPP